MGEQWCLGRKRRAWRSSQSLGLMMDQDLNPHSSHLICLLCFSFFLTSSKFAFCHIFGTAFEGVERSPFGWWYSRSVIRGAKSPPYTSSHKNLSHSGWCQLGVLIVCGWVSLWVPLGEWREYARKAAFAKKK